jgi:hypothetical protein
MNAHVTKPVDPAMLYRCLAKYLETGRDAALSLTQLAKVDGLDCHKAVTKLNGRTALYLGLVKDFSLHWCLVELSQLAGIVEMALGECTLKEKGIQ